MLNVLLVYPLTHLKVMARMTSIGTKPSFYMFLNLQPLPMNVIVFHFIAHKRKDMQKSERVKIFIFVVFVARFCQFL